MVKGSVGREEGGDDDDEQLIRHEKKSMDDAYDTLHIAVIYSPLNSAF